jgi:hypothetical protein
MVVGVILVVLTHYPNDVGNDGYKPLVSFKICAWASKF